MRDRGGEQAQQVHEAGADDQRLRDGGVADGVGIRRRAVLDEVDSGYGGKPLQAFANAWDVQPRGEETGRLGALTGRNDNKHGRSLP